MKPLDRINMLCISVWIAAVTIYLAAGCASFQTNAYRTIGVTAHSVDTLMTTWADASVAGRTSPDLDAKVSALHAQYRLAAAQAKLVIDGYRSGTNTQQQVEVALTAISANKLALLNLIVPLVSPAQAAQLKGLP